MRVDVLTIFPDYLRPLDLSLVGRARRAGILDLSVHDLRSWTEDRHRTVDDTPFGGGAGMVMRPDVWGRALDDVLTPGAELIVPTPAGEPFTQAVAEELATRPALAIACGRYEGIDARVVEHYAAAGYRVRETSVGDYVLNGGEVAALVVVEAVARLLPGVLGNPDSLLEESHGPAGLLEYPLYTKPVRWRGLEVPDVLLSGDHGRVARWRRAAALARTAERRPDLLTRLDPSLLDGADPGELARRGWVRRGGRLEPVRIRAATTADAAGLAALAALTFPLACPPSLGDEDIRAFVADHLSVDRMVHYVSSARHRVLLAEDAAGQVVGYVLVVLPERADEPPHADDVAAVVTARPAAELSKCYTHPDYHGSGLAAGLTGAAVDAAAAARVEDRPPAVLWLGTNRRNARAQRFYRKLGFARVGTRRFRVGGAVEEDVVMALPLGR